MSQPLTSFQPIKMVTYAMLAGQIIFTAVVLLISKDNLVFYKEGDVFLYIVPAVLLGAITLSFNMDKFLPHEIKPDAALSDKLGAYQTSTLVKLAPLEGAGIFSIVAMLLNNSYIYLIFLAVAIAAFLMLLPAEEKFVRQYKLTSEERRELGIR